MQKKIACYGSCITRDNFNSKLNHNYKERYRCVVTSEHSSIISVLSPEVKFDSEKLDYTVSKFAARNKEIAEADLNKTFLRDLIENQPDYLIMDFFPDIFFGVVFSNDNIMTNNHWYLCNTTYYKELPQKFILKIENDTSNYLSVWMPAMENFMRFIKNNLPNCNVIINKARFGNRVLENNTVSYLQPLSLYNEIWDKIDNYVINKFHLKYIQLDHSKYFLTKNHTLGWNLFHLHYHDNYYHDFMEQLDILIGD